VKGERVCFWECGVYGEVSCPQAAVPSTPKVSSCREMLLQDRLLSPSPEPGQAHWPGHGARSLPTPRSTAETEHVKQRETL